ncbi:MAG: band 7 protein [uncultured bacterium]|nr:MAG: band 7 protein [uncultured bacterium]
MIFLITLVLLLLMVIGLEGIKTVHQHERLIIERLGEYRGDECTIEIPASKEEVKAGGAKTSKVTVKGAGSGLVFLIPFIDRVVNRVDLREIVDDYPEQDAITADNVPVNVDTVVYYQVTDPYQHHYHIKDMREGILKISISTMRDQFGKMTFDDVLKGRNRINKVLRNALDPESERWGVRINRVEVKHIKPTGKMAQEMERGAVGERKRRETVLQGKAEREAMEEVAKGKKADLDAKMTALGKGDPKQADPRLVVVLNSQEAMTKVAEGQATKIFLPIESASVLGAVGVAGEILKETLSAKEKEPKAKKEADSDTKEKKPERGTES